MAAAGSQRIDKWLFFARVVKSRSLAAKLVQTGGVRVNSAKIDQPAFPVKPGDGLTISLERRVIVYRVLLPGTRRGPAEEARALYEDLTPPPTPKEERLDVALRDAGAGRPTKRDRRLTDRWRDQE
ncbi:MAG: RNA-binding S4 domain-containing protein [Mesorhizobium sp.]|nr:RNA-binding S4 domain-containing protein [Mesorhizobium sp.]